VVRHPAGKISGHIDGITLAASEVRRIRRVENRPPVVWSTETVVEDLKTRADDRLIDQVRRFGPPPAERRQVYTYVWLLAEFGADVDDDRPRKGLQRSVRALGPLHVDRVRLRYVARDRGTEYIHEEPVDLEMVTEARERYEYVAASASPMDVPREQDGPGLSYVCDSCPFVTACWGAKGEDDEGRWPQRIRIIEGSTTEETEIAAYLEGAAIEKAAKDRKALARATLSGSEPAQYGMAGKLGWSGGRPVGPVEDVDAMRDLLVRAGVQIPVKDGGRTSRTISVRPV
jgi:hypothetical protein